METTDDIHTDADILVKVADKWSQNNMFLSCEFHVECF